MDIAEMQNKFKGTVAEYLAKVKAEAGEDVWKAEIRRLAVKSFQMGGQHEAFWRDQIKDFDWITADEVKKEAAAMPPLGMGNVDVNQLIAQTIKQRIPGIKTQGQFNTFKAAFEAFEAVANAIFNGDVTQELELRKVLETAWTACKQATELTRKLEAVPEAATSKAAEEFKQPPAEFSEYDVQRGLLEELKVIQNFDLLKSWYEETKKRRDSVKSQTLRDVLMDSIRARKMELAPKEQDAP
jgi:hypothetical protein